MIAFFDLGARLRLINLVAPTYSELAIALDGTQAILVEKLSQDLRTQPVLQR